MPNLLDIHVYANGIVCCSVCVPKEWTAEEVTRATNEANPTRIASDWEVSKDKTFKGGEPMPNVCEQSSSRRHWLMNC